VSVSLVRERIVLHASSEEETASARMKDALPLHSEASPSSSLLLSDLELGDTKVYAPYI